MAIGGKDSKMRKLIVFITLSNLLSFSAIYVFEFTSGDLNILFASDYAFYSMLLLIGLGTVFSFSGHKVGYSDPSNGAGVVASSLIENNSPKTTTITKLESTNLGHRFFIASLLPLAFCFFA